MKTKIYGHRGAKGHAPENTMSSFKLAMEMGVDGIETDVHLSKDGHLVLIHDEKVDRTTNSKGYIKDMSLEEIKELDAGIKFSEEFKGEKIPTLEELIRLTQGTDIILNIEIKNNKIDYPDIEEKLVEMIEKYGIEERVLVSSFNHSSVYKIKELNENLKTGLIYSKKLKHPLRLAKNIRVDAIHPKYTRIKLKLMIRAKLMGLEVNPFTINKENHIQRMFKSKVDGIITDYPDKVLKFRKRR